jgi:hypothetical protein
MTVAIDPRRSERRLYAPGAKPELVDVPDLSFLMIDGAGDPNTAAEYANAIEAMYGVAFAMRFALKRGAGIDHPVMPLEGLWWVEGDVPFLDAPRDLWRWTMMIRQAEDATPDLLAAGVAKARERHPNPALTLLRLGRFTEGKAAQVMHTGPYSDERPTIEALHAFIADQGLTPRGRHHEIYLGDPRKTAPERLRTVIRQPAA